MASHDESFTPDQSQQLVVDRVTAGDHGPLLVRGGPGTGKTTTAAHLALRFLQAGHDSHELLVLSPSRTSSARLRDAVETGWARDPQQGTMTDQPSRSFASYAFRILSEARRRGFLDLADRAPRLLSGAEQDREIAALLASEETDIEWRVVDPASAGTAREKVRADLREAVGTAGFRKEIRELFDRATEYGVSPEQLRTWGQQAAAGDPTLHPAWQPAGELYGQYLDVLGQQAPHAFDPSGLVARACDLLEEHQELLSAERKRLGLIVVDDLQEANPNVLRLLRLIGAEGPVVAFANTEVAVQGFRGARPDLLASWTAEVLTLTGNHRMSERIGEVYGRVVERIGVVGGSGEYLDRWRQLAIESRADLQKLAEVQKRAEVQSVADPAPDGSPVQRSPAPRSRSGPHWNFPDHVDTAALGVTVSIVGSEQHAEQMILQEVLERHHRGGADGLGVPWSRMAVITRNGAAVHRISRLLASHGLPVTRSMSEVVLREESAVSPLLQMMRAVTSPATEEPFDLPTVLALLSGPYGGVDAVASRRLRQRLLAMERARAVESQDRTVGTRSSEQLLREVVADPADPLASQVMSSEHRALRGLQRLLKMVSAARDAAADPGAGPTDVLWALWTASGRQAPWVVASEGGGAEARRANRDLDAVVALFEAAERYTEQLPGQSLHHFVEYIEEMELPMDTLAETSTVDDAISVLTPATAAGREFDTVILTGMQDGVWPNLTPRGELLGSSLLVDIVSGAGDPGSRSARAKRMQVLQDEFRLFAMAVSRARHRLVGIGITGTEETPSLLIDLLVPAVLRTSPELVRPQPMTAPSLVAALRTSLEAHAASCETAAEQAGDEAGAEALGEGRAVSDEEAEDAARALAILGQAWAESTSERIVGAAPQQWWGLIDPREFEELITEAELDDEDGPQVRLSPSSVAQAQSAPLAWFIDAVGGTAATDQARDLGTLIHSIAEDHPVPAPGASLRDTEDILQAVLAARWPELGLDPQSYESTRRFAEAEQMINRLAWYLHASQEAGREHLLSEARITATTTLPIRGVPRPITVSGTLDRLEREEDGRYYIVDYKTGSSLPSRCGDHPHSRSKRAPSPDCDICRSVQLGLYQHLMRLPQEQKTIRHTDTSEAAAHAPPTGETSGAALLYVADPRTTIAGIEYIQRPIGDAAPGEDWPEGAQAWPDLALVDAAATVTGARFAVHHTQGASCRAGTLCPICASGRVVTQPSAE